MLLVQEDHIRAGDLVDLFKWCQTHGLVAVCEAGLPGGRAGAGKGHRTAGVCCIATRVAKKQYNLTGRMVHSKRLLCVSGEIKQGEEKATFALYNMYAHAGQDCVNERIGLMDEIDRDMREHKVDWVLVTGDWNSFYHVRDKFYFGKKDPFNEKEVHTVEAENWKKICSRHDMLGVAQSDDAYTFIHNARIHAARLTRVYTNCARQYIDQGSVHVRTAVGKPEDVTDPFAAVYPTRPEEDDNEYESLLYYYPDAVIGDANYEPGVRELFREKVFWRFGIDPFTERAIAQLWEGHKVTEQPQTIAASAEWYATEQSVPEEVIRHECEVCKDLLKEAIWEAARLIAERGPTEVSSSGGRILLLTKVQRLAMSEYINAQQDKRLQSCCAAWPLLREKAVRKVGVFHGCRHVRWTIDSQWIKSDIDRLLAQSAAETQQETENEELDLWESTGTLHMKSMRDEFSRHKPRSNLEVYVLASGELSEKWSDFYPEVKHHWASEWDHEACRGYRESLDAWHEQQPGGIPEEGALAGLEEYVPLCAQAIRNSDFKELKFEYQRSELLGNLDRALGTGAGPDRILFKVWRAIRAWYVDLQHATLDKNSEGYGLKRIGLIQSGGPIRKRGWTPKRLNSAGAMLPVRRNPARHSEMVLPCVAGCGAPQPVCCTCWLRPSMQRLPLTDARPMMYRRRGGSKHTTRTPASTIKL